MARTMMHENNLAKFFWAEAVNIACYIKKKEKQNNFLSLTFKLLSLLSKPFSRHPHP
jgi:hypothetical protein